MGLTREQILAAQDLRTEPVDVPEWGGKALVREMTASERDAWEQSLVTLGPDGKHVPDMRDARAKLVATCLVDDRGDRLFAADEIALLGKKSSAALQRVFDVAQRLNGLGAGGLEEAVKNSAPVPSGGPTSD